MIRPMTSTGRDFSTIGVIGLGTMGAGIAEVFARNGYQVVGVELTEESLERGRQHVQHSTDRAVKRGKLSEDEQAALVGAITFTTNIADAKDCQLVVEAIVEQLPLKQALFPALDGIVAPDAILATNTSSLSVTEISTATSRPGRVVGLHFFNPAPVQHLVEIIRTVVTEPDVLDDVAALARSLDKTPVICGDKAGFIANALLFGYLNHAVAMYESHYATREDIDAAMRLRLRLPDGPARAARPDRPRHRLRDPRHDVQAGPRPAARAGADPQADGHRRPARPQDRPRLLHLRGPRLPGRRRRRADPLAGRGAPAAPRRPPGRRGRLRHDGRRHRRGVRQGRVRRHLRRPQPGEGRRRARRRSTSRSRRRPARQARGVRAGRRRSPGSPAAPASTTSPTVDLVVEAIVEDLDRQDGAVREPRRDLQARRDPGHHDLLAAGDRPGRCHPAPAGRRRHALLQPGAGDEAGRGGLDRQHG